MGAVGRISCIWPVVNVWWLDFVGRPYDEVVGDDVKSYCEIDHFTAGPAHFYLYETQIVDLDKSLGKATNLISACSSILMDICWNKQSTNSGHICERQSSICGQAGTSRFCYSSEDKNFRWKAFKEFGDIKEHCQFAAFINHIFGAPFIELPFLCNYLALLFV